MAYMNQEKKKIIASALKEVMPKDWKYSLSVEHHSVIHLNIKSAPFDLTHGKDDVQINLEANYISKKESSVLKHAAQKLGLYPETYINYVDIGTHKVVNGNFFEAI